MQFSALLGIFYRFVDSLRVAYRLGDRNSKDCLVELASGTLRSVAGQNVLQSIIESRSLVCSRVTRQLNDLLDYWGIYVEITSIKGKSPLIQKCRWIPRLRRPCKQWPLRDGPVRPC